MHEAALKEEIKRLKRAGLGSGCCAESLDKTASLTLKINDLKKRRKAVICAHVYQFSEIIFGIGDFVGDSYKLAADSIKTNAAIIVFCGVHFMGETAKILNPEKKVFVPSGNAGCSLSEGITAEDVKALKKEHPGAPVVTYINTSAGVKAESDCVVTSANAEKILAGMYKKNEKVIFIPDRLMGANIARRLRKTPGKDMVLWNASCVVHDKFRPETIKKYRRMHPGLAVLAHSECPAETAGEVDFLGGTSDMLQYVENTNAPAYMLITECGLGEVAKTKFPRKNFIAMCRLCPYMKSVTLESVLKVLENLPKDMEIKVPRETAWKAKKAIDKMFELAA